MAGYQDDPVSTRGSAGDPPSPSDRPLDVGRLWAGGAATAVVAGLVALFGVLVVQAVLRLAVYSSGAAGTFGGSATVVLCITAVLAALAATGLAHLLLTTTPRPLTYLSWIVGLATAVVVAMPFVTAPSLGLALAQAGIHLLVGLAIGRLVIKAAQASRPFLPPPPGRRFPLG